MLFLLSPTLFFIVIAILLVADVALFAFEKYAWSFAIMFGAIIGAYAVEPTFATFLKGSWPHILTHYLPVYLVLGFGTAVLKWMLFTVKRVTKIKEVKATFDVRNPTDKYVEFEDERIARERKDQEYQFAVRHRKINLTQPGGYSFTADNKTASVEDLEKQYPEPIRPETISYTADIAAARRRKAFVDFYSKSFGYGSGSSERAPKIHEVDFAKQDSVVDALTPRAKDHIGLITIWIFQWPIVILCTLFEDLLMKLAKHTARLLDAMFSYVSRKLVASATKGL